MGPTAWFSYQHCSSGAMTTLLPTIGNSDETSRTTIQPASCRVIVLNTSYHGEHLVCIAIYTTRPLFWQLMGLRNDFIATPLLLFFIDVIPSSGHLCCFLLFSCIIM